MIEQLKAFVVVVTLNLAAVFVLSVFLKGTLLGDILRARRAYWIAAIVIAFVAQNFFVAMALIGALAYWAARKDPNPLGVYLLLLLAVPPWGKMVGGFGLFNELLVLNHFRVLSLCILLPLAIRTFRERGRKSSNRDGGDTKAVDITVVAFALFMLLMHVPHESVTTLMRRSVQYGLDLLLPYYVLTRHLRTRQAVMDAMGSVLIAALLLTPVAVFEYLKGWLIYEPITRGWDIMLMTNINLERGGRLRAVATTSSSIVLGHFFAIALALLGAFLSQLRIQQALLLGAALLAGIAATLSRGPMLGAFVIVVLIGLIMRRPVRFYVITLPALLTISLLGAALSGGDRLERMLSFGGSEAAGTIDYRMRILETAITLMRQDPLFGNVLVVQDLEHLRQGQGIIDLVNTYVVYGLSYGSIGLGLFVAFLCFGLAAAVRAFIRARRAKSDLFQPAAALVLALTASMIIIATVSDIDSIPLLNTTLVALSLAIVRLQGTVSAKRPQKVATA